MLWLGLYFPQLPLEVFAADGESAPLAVTRRDAGRDVIDRCNSTAQEQGICAGMPLQGALALLPGLQVRQRDKNREQQAMESLAGWAWQYSSRISFDPLLLLLETGASLKLFGGFPGLLEQMRRDRPCTDCLRHWALAPSPMAASLLARTRPETCIHDREQLGERLADIPLQSLTRNARVLELMRGIGLSSIGDCLGLPRPELARRAGPELTLLLDRLLGRTPDPRPLWRPPEIFSQRLLLLSEISHANALLFPARRLVASLCGFLRGRGVAAQHLQWRFLHRNAEPTLLEQGLLRPSREAEHILDLFRQSLERLKLPGAVLEVALQVENWQEFQEGADDLFPGGRGARDEKFLERLRARLGSEAVRGVQMCPDYRPERAWRYCEPAEAAQDPGVSARRHARQPVWLLPGPQLLPERHGRPWHEGALQLQAFSQRVETGWWDGGDVARDYYRASNPAGRQLWIYRERDSGQWFLQGFFD